MAVQMMHRLPLLVVLALAQWNLFACVVASGRDDVPQEIAKQANPVELEASELRYYKRQFKGKCSRCHGPDGKGGGEHAASQAIPPTDFSDLRYMQTRTDGQLFYQILMGGGDRCAMPAFGPESDYAWSEEKIWHLVAYVRRFAETAGN
jgi:mono/diheme cytochrome c family protein